MPNFHRVVITGIGAVTPIGNNIDEYLLGLQKGINGVSGITLFDPAAQAVDTAELGHFAPRAIAASPVAILGIIIGTVNGLTLLGPL